MDLRMPVMDGLTAIDQLQRAQPEVAVIILTTYDEDDLILRGLRAGARGYLLKDTNRTTLLDAIRAAARGILCSLPRSSISCFHIPGSRIPLADRGAV